MSVELLAGLNAEQRDAVTWPARSALILAGAGSGKTRVLITRIAWLIHTGQVTPNGILAVTFTNKAARAMQTRLSAMIATDLQSMWVGTFHGLCHRFLRIHRHDAGLIDTFQILDAQDQLAIIKRLLKNLDLSDERFPPKAVRHFINHHKEAGQRANTLSASDDYTAKLIELYAIYDAQCHREGVLDFAELLLRSYEVLSTNLALREHYRSRFRFILADEFQDTNRLQYAWLKLLIGPESSLFAVGDDDQSIYAFRGAEVGNMQALLHDFAVAKPVRLEQNYRSMGMILKAANALIGHNNGRLGKNLWTEAGDGELLRVYQAWSDIDEANFIIDQVSTLHQKGIPLTNIAILYRSNAQSRVLEQRLVNAHVRYRVYGGLRFFERQEIKHALAYLRLVANVDNDNALLRVINIPIRGIGTRTIQNLQFIADGQRLSLWQAICTTSTGRTAANLAKFIDLINTLRERCAGLCLAETVSLVVAECGLLAMYQQDNKEGQERLANLDELINAAAAFSVENSDIALIEFLAAASLEAGEHQAEEGEDALQLMTIHASKGLEFDTVFIAGLEEGLFPHDNALTDSKGLEEERRLMYVALTRARQRLYLSHAQTRLLHGLNRYPIRSRFIDELPSELLSPLPSRSHLPVAATPSTARRGRSAAASDWQGFHLGQTVSHHKFGTGVILNAEGNKTEARLQINFATHGIKWLDLRYAKLATV